MTTALRLRKPFQSVTINAAPPFEGKINYLDGKQTVFASSVEAGVPTISYESADWLRDIEGNLLFDIDKQLLEL